MIPYGRHSIDDQDIQAVVAQLRSGSLTQGKTVEEFENHIKNYVGATYAVAVSSGSAGLHMAYQAVDMKEGDTLLTSPITFVATTNAAIHLGANVTFADIEEDTLNISPVSIEEKLKENKNIKIISPVHFGGLACDMKLIKEKSNKTKSFIVEDAAHALGSAYQDGSLVGNCKYSDMTVFSFHPVKAIAAGEGGMITTNDEGLYRKLLRLRSHGINKLNDDFLIKEQGYTNDLKNPWYYEMQQIGYNYRITDIQCALAISQLKKLDKFIDKRKELALEYDKAFRSFKYCQPAQIMNRNNSGIHLYILRIDFNNLGKSRAEVMSEMKSMGIGSQVHYIPIPMHPFYTKLGHSYNDYPVSLKYYEQALSIPLFYELTDQDQKHVINSLMEVIG